MHDGMQVLIVHINGDSKILPGDGMTLAIPSIKTQIVENVYKKQDSGALIFSAPNKQFCCRPITSIGTHE